MSNAETKGRPIAAERLAAMLWSGQPLFLLDVRNEADYAEWRIEGKSLQSVNKPYFELLDGVDEALPLIPADLPVVVACAKEGSSRFVADRLAERGVRDIAYLAGGMSAWSETLVPVKIGDLSGGGALYQFIRPGKGCLSYMAVSGGEAAVIDAARMTDAYRAFADERQAVIAHAIDTHLHADHISGGRQLAEETGAAYWLPPKDAEEAVFDYRPLEESADIAVGRTRLAIVPMHSPGHTAGSASIVIDGRYLLSGDTLFVASIGRPDLAGAAQAWAADLRETLYRRYKSLPDDLIVLPGHYGSLSEMGEDGSVSARLGDLYRNNPGLNIGDEAAFRRAVTEQLPPQPNAYRAIRQVNMGRLAPSEEEKREMEIGPNRCAIHE